MKHDIREGDIRNVVNEVAPMLDIFASRFPEHNDLRQELWRCRNLLKGTPSIGTDLTAFPYFSTTVYSKQDRIDYCLLAACTCFLATYYEAWFKMDDGGYDFDSARKKLKLVGLHLKHLADKPLSKWTVEGTVSTGYHIIVCD